MNTCPDCMVNEDAVGQGERCVPHELSYTRGQLMTVREELHEWRKALWLRHGCPITALYGDDGEMSCGICLVDFKRNSLADINTGWTKRGENLLARYCNECDVGGSEDCKHRKAGEIPLCITCRGTQSVFEGRCIICRAGG